MIIALILAQAAAAPAADAPPLPNDEVIIVTGRGLAPPIGDAAYASTEIERGRIVAAASGRLEDVLRDVAGLQQFRRSDARTANPTSQGLTLRGLGGNASSRALLILDGVPQTDPFGGWISLPAYAPERLSRVRVTRGAASGVFGPGALAGTIELDSAGPAELDGISADVAYGSRDSVDAGVVLAGRPGGGFANLSADYARGDGFVPIVRGARGPADRAAPYEQASVSARGVAPLGASTEIQANILAFTDARERGVAFTDNRTDGADASLRVVGQGALPWSALVYVQTRAFASRFAAVSAGRQTATLTLDQYNTPATGLGARAEIAPRFGDAEIRLGGDWRRTSGETKERFSYQAGGATRLREAGGTTETLGLFADLGVEATDALTLSLGGRIDRWSIRDGARAETPIGAGTLAPTLARFADRSGWEPTARAGVAFEATPDLTLRAAAYTGWRLPTLNELYRPFRVGADATAANEALSPERLRGGEIGVTVRPAEGVRLAATAFLSRLENAIANVTLARGPGTFPGVGFVSAAGSYRARRNLDAVESRGVELDGEATVGPVRLFAAYAFADATVDGSGQAAALDGLRPAQVPLHQASATIAAAGASVTARYVSAQWEDDANQRRLAPAVTLDATARVPLGARLAIEARAENIFDEVVEAAISDDGVIERASPRTLWIGLRYGL